jgi:hypothetical protein
VDKKIFLGNEKTDCSMSKKIRKIKEIFLGEKIFPKNLDLKKLICYFALLL